MSRLRKPVRAIREPLGTAGLIVAIVALVAALGGGAYAASSGSSGAKATASAKGKQGPRGKTGKTGPAGPAGLAGAPGAKGDTGAAGSNGTNGTNGTSVTTASFSGAKAPCTAGGVEVKSASAPALVCNGKNGQTGFTETLPSGATETGAWASTPLSEVGQPQAALTLSPLSFAIPLANEISGSNVHLIDQAGKELPGELTQTACPGTAAAPAAELGHLCIYVGIFTNGTEFELVGINKLNNYSQTGASKAGAILKFAVAPNLLLGGSWAVTAP
jgi:Collagen triple helix repeat (20 copies)